MSLFHDGQVCAEVRIEYPVKAQHPQGVFFEIVGVEKALHQQETVDGKGQPTHQPQKLVQPHQPGVDGAAAEQALYIPKLPWMLFALSKMFCPQHRC